ncbi:phosphoglucomutase, alpha-D-glucose phosphate-specific [Janthinobacterium sp. ROICE36]|uniref:phosphoglucomutase (alpha-D-glucose-1,6-bisphosphate-dependent) n=1 Tax=Janthinobacterium sp. ROICE36 TaxID=2048670 RepID=UPI000C7F5330|nr:phosphoglucomutase (alpha-D-glucose-1,6-bisphosphate-dependent) [Janthinobacterium sp. ROICE36]PLY39790.1 phosphoglucomutase, alpha-D-glucose phosphate-specific [Janthinobacterium sp. ROICE36]
MNIHPLAGQVAPLAMLVDVPRLVSMYYTSLPDPGVAAQRVAFGTSGHRGSSFQTSFNERHVLAISQAICEYRARQGTSGPLYLGIDTHALSVPACASALEVLAANGVDVMLAMHDEYTPTPAVSLAILMHNCGRTSYLADGVVITPSHNPPDNGGFKYNSANGGPADTDVTDWIGKRANAFLECNMAGVKRMPLERALRAGNTHRYDFMGAYVDQLGQVVDLALLGQSGVRMGVDPLGGAGVHYWARIAEQYKLDLTVVSDVVDPTFRFMTLDWDGKIRMDPSSSYAMRRLLGLQQRFDVAFACDTDHDRHGIVTPGAGLMKPDHYLAVAIDYLFRHRARWGAGAGVGKTVVSSSIIDRVSARLARPLFDVPVGFKWFAAGLYDGVLGFGGEESAGAAFLRMDGTVWTTDKDGLIAALLAGEIKARTGRDPGQLYQELAREFGDPVGDRVEAPATPAQKQVLASLSPHQVTGKQLAGEPITEVLTRAPGNDEIIGGVKVVTEHGWFAARPSGTEDIYKIYAESFNGKDHLRQIVREAQVMVDAALAAGDTP